MNENLKINSKIKIEKSNQNRKAKLQFKKKDGVQK